MTFIESVQTCFKKYVTFDGCASRPEFWWWILFVVVASLVLSFVSRIVSGIFSLATLLPSIAVTTRRLHDTDRTGWLQLIALVPLVGWIIVLVLCAQPEKRPSRFCG